MTSAPLPSPPPGPPAASAQANTYTDLNGLAALKNAPASPATIKAVSEQVEALFLQMMLKSMRDASEAAGEPASNETGMYQDMFDKQVALSLSKRQDLGIARLFERQLGGSRAAGKTEPATAMPLPQTRPTRPLRAVTAMPPHRPPARTSQSTPSSS